MLSLLRELLFPIECLGCKQEGDWICASCFRRLRPSRAIKDLNLNIPNLDRLGIAGDYDDPLLAEAIKKFKFNFVQELAPILSHFLARHFAAELVLDSFRDDEKKISPTTSVVAIPLSKKRERWRGFNQAELLARPLAAEFGFQIMSGLHRVKDRPAQSSLSARERQMNIKAVFAWTGERLDGQEIILIDDVITTGATLNEAAGALKAAGAERITGLVLAKG